MLFYYLAIQDLGKISFEMLCYTEEELAMFSFDIFKFLNIHPEFNIKEQTLKDLMREITFNYNIVSYHNYTHAFSVFQVTKPLTEGPITAIDVFRFTTENQFEGLFRKY